MNSNEDLFDRATNWAERIQSEPTTTWIINSIQNTSLMPDVSVERLLTVCFGILALKGLGELEKISLDKRSAWGRYIQSAQNPTDGGFGAGELEDHSLTGLKHTLRSLRAAYFSTLALTALDLKALHPLKFLHVLREEKFISDWLDALDWRAAHLASEQAMYLLNLLIYSVENADEALTATTFHAALDKLETLQDQKTGLWGTQFGGSLKNALVAGFHLLPFFSYVHRPVTHLSWIVDSTLQVLESNPTLLVSKGEDFYIGFAGASLLAMLCQNFTYRREEIRKVLDHLRDTLNSRQAEDITLSAFNDARIIDAVNDEYPSLSACAGYDALLDYKLHEMALAATTFCSESAPEYESEPLHWPVNGWYSQGRRLSQQQRDHFTAWLRPLRQTGGHTGQLSGNSPSISVIIPCYNQGI